MEVMIYIEEAKGSMVSQPEEWVEKAKEVGLAGQMKFMPGAEQPASANLLPFRRMTPNEVNVWKQVLPNRTGVNDFAEEPIPLKALSVIALAQKERWFCEPSDTLEIWHRYGHPDPLVVGKKYQRVGADHYYMLAQWGPEIIPFAKAQSQAIHTWVREKSGEIKKELVELTQKAQHPELLLSEAYTIFGTPAEAGKLAADTGDIPF